ncbi:MAG: hypothetical protein K2Y37_22585 [Pirellulales bacterium]|nr:hypothetical protein [Pirellulales bacterium]
MSLNRNLKCAALLAAAFVALVGLNLINRPAKAMRGGGGGGHAAGHMGGHFSGGHFGGHPGGYGGHPGAAAGARPGGYAGAHPGAYGGYGRGYAGYGGYGHGYAGYGGWGHPGYGYGGWGHPGYGYGWGWGGFYNPYMYGYGYWPNVPSDYPSDQAYGADYDYNAGDNSGDNGAADESAQTPIDEPGPQDNNYDAYPGAYPGAQPPSAGGFTPHVDAAPNPKDQRPHDRGAIHIVVPNQYTIVSFDGQKMLGTGKDRLILTPTVEPGHDFKYQIQATWTDASGKTVTQVREGTIQAGQYVVADFTKPQPEITPVSASTPTATTTPTPAKP